MSGKKVIAICQSGGEFVTSADGSLSYSGGEAYAVDVDGDTKVDDLKSELSEMFKCESDSMTIKYLLPGNRKTPISISSDKDLQRMLSFLGDSSTADLFVVVAGAATAIANAVIEPPIVLASRSSRTTVSDAPREEEEEDEEEGEALVQTAGAAPGAQQWEKAITGVDQRFGSFAEFREALHKYSIAHGFAYRYKKNDSHRVTVKCKWGGCPWRIYASRVSTTQLVCVKRMHPHHTCDGAAVKAGYRATRGWVGSVIKEKLKVWPKYKPKEIARDMERDFGIRLNYSQAWRAKEIAREQLQGSYKDAYSHLPALCHRIHATNPGSVATFTTDSESGCFHRLFLAFNASLCGFRNACRPLLFLHSFPLNSKYQGVLLTATAPDPDDSPFPLALAVADSDSPDTWRWFLSQLRGAIGPDTTTGRAFTFVSGIEAGIPAEAFGGECHHAVCLRRLAEDLNRDLKGQLSHEARRFMVNDLYAAAYAPTREGFERNVESIRGICGDAHAWVVGSGPERWANALFQGQRYNLMTSTFGQELYTWVSDAHELPITQMVDLLRGNMMHAMYSRRSNAAAWPTKLVPSKEDRLAKEVEAGRAHPVEALLDENENETETFEVDREKVELQQWRCSCNAWQVTGLPCSHALAAINCTGRSPYDYCSPYFTAENYRLAYAHSIHPIPDATAAAADQVAVTVTPPATKRPPGRPKTPKPDSIDVIKRQLQCSNCKGLGHNKKTCKRDNPPPLPPCLL